MGLICRWESKTVKFPRKRTNFILVRLHQSHGVNYCLQDASGCPYDSISALQGTSSSSFSPTLSTLVFHLFQELFQVADVGVQRMADN